MTYDVTAHLHKLNPFAMKLSPEDATGHPLLSLKCADFEAHSNWLRAVTSLLCSDTVARGATGQVSTVLIGREPSRDL